MLNMFKSNVMEYKNGWILGNFSPAVIQTNDFEVCVKSFKVGDREASHYQVIATEVTVVLSGRVRMGEVLLAEDEILVVEPGEVVDFEALTDCKVLGIKFPSFPEDKVTV
jgi:mannose-6-phosphate isomerase-like protein (cupin superfamily)